MIPARLFCAIVAAIPALLADAALAGPAMSTNWQTTALERDDCIKQGEAAMRAANLAQHLQTFQESIYGENGDYTAAIRCPNGKGLVFFVVAGPRPERASKLMGELREKF
jgi:hypothetical protein